MHAVSFEVPGSPVPWARASGGKGAPRFTPAKQRNYMATVKQYAEDAAAGRYFADGPLSLSVLAVYEWPKSVSARKRALPEARFKTSRPDLSNIAKLVEDALNGVVWHDDAQIASSRVQKVYGDRPRLLVLIEPLGAA